MAQTWEYRGCVIEEDFDPGFHGDRRPAIARSGRTGYLIRARGYTDRHLMYVPGRYDTLAEAKRAVDEELKEGGWLWHSANTG
jgi:hypothetical protein